MSLFFNIRTSTIGLADHNRQGVKEIKSGDQAAKTSLCTDDLLLILNTTVEPGKMEMGEKLDSQ